MRSNFGSQKSTSLIRAALFALGFIVSSCGVKSDIVPPDEPAEIGRGSPRQNSFEKSVAPLDERYKPEDEVKDESDEEEEETQNSKASGK